MSADKGREDRQVPNWSVLEGGILTRWIKAGLLFSLFIVVMAHFSACGTGGGDAPFVFGGEGSGGQPSGSPGPGPGGGGGGCDPACPTGQVCQDGSCVPAAPACDSNNPCPPGQICQDGSCVPAPTGCDSNDDCTSASAPRCLVPPGQCVQCLNNSDCPGGECNTSSHTCTLSGACEVDFDASLVLKIDDAHTTQVQHYDSPSACCQYAEADNDSTCPTLNPIQLDHFMQSPSEAYDLYCCATNPAVDTDVDTTGVSLPPYVHSLYCDAENRHGPQPELAVTRWKGMQPGGQGAGKIKLRFSVTGTGPGNCQVEIDAVNFPEYRLDNTALDAALIIDAGKDYQTFGGAQPLNPETIGTCEVTETPGGNIEVKITSLPLRFMARLYQSHSQCVAHIRSQPDVCPEAFSTSYYPDPAASVQILPGFSVPPLSLATEHREIPVVNDALQDPMAITGSPLRFQEGMGSRMALVVAFSMPDNGFVGFRDDEAGTGQLNAQLNSALLTAELAGPVTKAGTSQSIQTMADLTNCTGVTPPTQERLDLTVQADYEPDNPANQSENLTVSGDPENPDGGFTAATSFPETNRPFAKEQADLDTPILELAGRFSRGMRLNLIFGSTTTVDVPLSIPTAPVGAFRVTNAANFQNMTLAKGHENPVSLDIQFEPTMIAGSNCDISDAATGIVTCQADLTISTSPSIIVHLAGQAKSPAPNIEMKMTEVNQVAPNGPMTDLLPASPLPTIDFGQALLRYETKVRLLQITNTGVRDLAVSGLQAVDAQKNFRMGSVYRGADFENRQWIMGQPKPWNVPATGASNLFFFLNYGPFGVISGGAGGTRNDNGFLNLMTNAGNFNLSLTGVAKEDRRARVALYIRDERRFEVTNQTDLEGPSGEHLYLAENQFFSFRQDSSVQQDGSPDRAVYLKNVAPSGAEDLLVQDFQVEDAAGKFSFTIDPAFQTVLTACAGDPNACPVVGTSAPANLLKVGTVTFNAVTSGSYSISAGKFKFRAVSRQSSVTPVVVDNTANEDDGIVIQCSGGMICYDIKGANGAPHRVGASKYDLRVHRLFAGLHDKFPNSDARAISTTTRGLLERMASPPGNPNDYVEVFTIPNLFELDAEKGTAVLQPVFTEIAPPLINPTQKPYQVDGIRVFNGPGSAPVGNDFYIQCERASGSPQCVFFYLYLGAWSSTAAQCGGQPVIGATASATGSTVDPAAQEACMRAALVPMEGSYDPVTGEITLENLAVRLFSPVTPASGSRLDATLHLDLTTGCVSDDMMYNVPSDQRLVPNLTLNYTVPGFMPQNPLSPYASDATCGERRLHGRPMVSADANDVDDTGTLDALSELPASAFDFDLSGVSVVTTHFGQANGNDMYIVIKAEVGDF